VTKLIINQIKLSNFRNYSFLDVCFEDKPIVITGQNGSGKTNMLEAISLLTPGRGIRNATIGAVSKYDSTSGASLPWSVYAEISTPEGGITIGTGKDANSDTDKRLIKINGTAVSNQSELGQYFSVCSLTPDMDQTFTEGTTSRRNYLDKLTTLFYPDHSRQLSIYNHARSERAKLLATNKADPIWLNTIERRMSEQAIAIAAARLEVISQLQHAIDTHTSSFPKAKLSIQGYVEEALTQNKAIEAEQKLQEKLKSTRPEDKQSGRTMFGTHRSDFSAIHSIKNMPAQLCSTGEQKALLLSITMATIRARKSWTGTAPVLLLDEVVAHLDEQKRGEFFNELLALGTQTFLTGTDTVLFNELNGKSQFLTVDNGYILE
jgi:DNA replication and repair protein RecF